MHELSIAQSILDTIEETLGGKRPLLAVTLTVGPFAGVSADALDFCFTELARQGDFGAPRLIINRSPAALHCDDCGGESLTENALDPCPDCGSFNRTILDGRECRIDNASTRGSGLRSHRGRGGPPQPRRDRQRDGR